MNKLIEKYISKEERNKMPIKQIEICKKIHTTYQNVGENDIMLSSALGVYIRLFL